MFTGIYLQQESPRIDCGATVYPTTHTDGATVYPTIHTDEHRALQTTLESDGGEMYCECQVLSGYRSHTSLVCSMTVTICNP